MRHLKAGRKFGRTSSHRKAMMNNLVTALIYRERIQTTLAKAKELRSHVEKTITLGKEGTLSARRRALKVLQEKEAFIKLFSTLSERYAKRPGGYTRIIKIGNRRGDDAPMAFIELVDREAEAPAKPAPEKKGKAKKEDAPKKADKKAESAEKKPAKKNTDAKKKVVPKKADVKKASVKAPAKKTNVPKSTKGK